MHLVGGGSWQPMKAASHSHLHRLWGLAKSKQHAEIIIPRIWGHKCCFANILLPDANWQNGIFHDGHRIWRAECHGIEPAVVMYHTLGGSMVMWLVNSFLTGNHRNLNWLHWNTLHHLVNSSGTKILSSVHLRVILQAGESSGISLWHWSAVLPLRHGVMPRYITIGGWIDSLGRKVFESWW